jgi:hypothetical protein
MRVLAHRLVLFVTILAFAAGLPLALAGQPALAAEPCPHEHHQMMAGHEHQHPAPEKPRHHHDMAGCLCCCMGIGFAMPDLAGPAITVPIATVLVVYPETTDALDGRSLRPDPAPPRTGALS